MLSGTVEKKYTIQGLSVSKGAREAIENAGGEILDSETKRSFATVKQDEPENKD